MDPRVARKLYTRTAICVINGAPNVLHDELMKKKGQNTKAYYPVLNDTNFDKAPLEDSIAFAVRTYADGSLIRVTRPTNNRAGDNKPTIPVSAIVNGMEAESAGELDDMLYVVGINMGEGAIQAGGSARTYNWLKLNYPPGTIIAGAVVSKTGNHGTNVTDKGNVHLAAIPWDPKEESFPLLDRGRTHVSLEWLKGHGGEDTFVLDNGAVKPHPNQPDMPKDVKRVLHFLVDTAFASAIGVASGGDDPQDAQDLKTVWSALNAYVDSGKTTDRLPALAAIAIGNINKLIKGYRRAYHAEAQGTSSRPGKTLIEPLEKFVIDQIAYKNNASRKVLGIVVAPVTTETPMIPFNFISYSR